MNTIMNRSSKRIGNRKNKTLIQSKIRIRKITGGGGNFSKTSNKSIEGHVSLTKDALNNLREEGDVRNQLNQPVVKSRNEGHLILNKLQPVVNNLEISHIRRELNKTNPKPFSEIINSIRLLQKVFERMTNFRIFQDYNRDNLEKVKELLQIFLKD